MFATTNCLPIRSATLTLLRVAIFDNTPQLGPVGGRIVAEVFLGMMFGDASSVLSLDPNWAPVTGPDFRLKDLVTYALGQGAPLH